MYRNHYSIEPSTQIILVLFDIINALRQNRHYFQNKSQNSYIKNVIRKKIVSNPTLYTRYINEIKTFVL